MAKFGGVSLGMMGGAPTGTGMPSGGPAQWAANRKRREELGMMSGGPFTLPSKFGPVKPASTDQGGGAPGAFAPGWQYPIGDPAAAVRNYFREAGIRWNPFNPAHEETMGSFSRSILPQFALTAAGGGYVNPSETAQSAFGRMIGERARNERPALTMGGAAGGLGDFNVLLRKLSEAVAGTTGFDLNTPEGRQKALESLIAGSGGAGGGGTVAGMNPMSASIVGSFLDPRMQQGLFQGAYAPLLGPFLSQGLGRAVSPWVQAWEDYVAKSTFGGGNAFMSLLDLLTGSAGIRR